MNRTYEENVTNHRTAAKRIKEIQCSTMSCLQTIHKSWHPISQNTSVQHFTEIPHFNDCVQMTRGRTLSSFFSQFLLNVVDRRFIHSCAAEKLPHLRGDSWLPKYSGFFPLSCQKIKAKTAHNRVWPVESNCIERKTWLFFPSSTILLYSQIQSNIFFFFVELRFWKCCLSAKFYKVISCTRG